MGGTLRGWTALGDLGHLQPLLGTSFQPLGWRAAYRGCPKNQHFWGENLGGQGSNRQPMPSDWRQGGWPHQDPQTGWGEGPLHPDSSWASPGHAQPQPPFYTSLVWRLGGGLTPLDGLREGTGAAGLQEEMCESSARVYSALS